MFSFGLSSVISKVFVADFEHVFFCWKRYSTKTIVVLILKYLAQQTNTYSKSAAETLKANCRDCASLWTTCSMSKTLFKCFLVYYEHVFVYCHVFVVTISFSMYLLSILNRFHTLIYFYLLSVLYWVQKKPPEVSFKKRCPLKLRNIFRKTAVLGSLFNKVVGLQDCKYIKKRLQHRCFVRNLPKCLRTPFLKNICERLLL